MVQEIWRHLFAEKVQEHHISDQRLEIYQVSVRQEKYTLQQPAAIPRRGLNHPWRSYLDDAVWANVAHYA